MPVRDRDEIANLEDSSEERVGELWRRQGEVFLVEAAAELAADVDRLRAVYEKPTPRREVSPEPVAARPKGRGAKTTRPEVIDLRAEDVSGLVCTRHRSHEAAARCNHCNNAFCSACIVRLDRSDGYALCTTCALELGGVRSRARRPATARERGR